ncbi:endolytic transglycosylase MltG, partial [Candidatus Margulisiibacteriota bacterium]
ANKFGLNSRFELFQAIAILKEALPRFLDEVKTSLFNSTILVYNPPSEKVVKELDACPTIKYALNDPTKVVLLEQLKVDSPYNTYKYRGLPPGPICNPGLDSIRAAIYPADTDYLYFVAKNDGSHVFSKTLAQHNRAKWKVNR